MQSSNPPPASAQKLLGASWLHGVWLFVLRQSHWATDESLNDKVFFFPLISYNLRNRIDRFLSFATATFPNHVCKRIWKYWRLTVVIVLLLMLWSLRFNVQLKLLFIDRRWLHVTLNYSCWVFKILWVPCFAGARSGSPAQTSRSHLRPCPAGRKWNERRPSPPWSQCSPRSPRWPSTFQKTLLT